MTPHQESSIGDPTGQIDFYRDPLHNYIPYTSAEGAEVTEKNLITSKWVQRLRRIYQLQCAWLVYPGAVHTRFIHSCGVMHLAGKFAAHLWDSYAQNIGTDSIPSKQHVVETCRMAGLLHDIGHGPMGHTLDEIYAKCGYKTTHEDIGRKIITEELADMLKAFRRSPYGSFSEPLEPEVIADMIKLPAGKTHRYPWAEEFSKLITGLYCVDILDYLMRDSYFCGTKEYGTVDTERFMYSTFISKEAGFTLHKGCLSALKSFFYSRFFMYENVYYHHKVRAFDFSFEELFIQAYPLMDIGDPLQNLAGFYGIDDTILYSIPARWKQSSVPEEKSIGEQWDSIQNLNKTWKCAYEMQYFPKDPLSKLFEPADVENKMKQLIYESLEETIPIKIDIPFLSLRPENLQTRGKTIAVYDPLSQNYDPLPLARLYSEIPFRMMMTRVYTKDDANFERVRNCIMDSLATDGYTAKTSF